MGGVVQLSEEPATKLDAMGVINPASAVQLCGASLSNRAFKHCVSELI